MYISNYRFDNFIEGILMSVCGTLTIIFIDAFDTFAKSESLDNLAILFHRIDKLYKLVKEEINDEN